MRTRGTWTAAIALVAACGGPPATGGAQEPANAARRPAARPPAASRAADDAALPLEEGPARRILAAAFRAAGHRVLLDVPLRTDGAALVVDGFDPEHRVGFEYIARDERGVELDDRERAALARDTSARLLILDATTADSCTRAATLFLQGQAPVRK